VNSLLSAWLMNTENAQSKLPSKQTTHTAEVEPGHVACVANGDGRFILGLILLTCGQCVYTSFKDPCQVCCDRNLQNSCVKITSAEYNPSRTVRAANGNCENDRDQILLEYIYSDDLARKLHTLSTLFRKLAASFGTVPCNTSLLHCLMALSSSFIPTERSNWSSDVEHHKSLAIRMLGNRMKNPSKIVEADAFGAALAVLLQFWKTPKVTCTSLINIFCTIMLHLSKRPTPTSAGVLRVLTPCIFDLVRCCTSFRETMWLISWRAQISGRLISSFGDRLGCEAELGHNLGCDLSGQFEATVSVIEDLIQMAWSCLYEEVNCAVLHSGRTATVRSVCAEIIQTLNDHDFQRTWELLQDRNWAPGQYSCSQILSLSFAMLGKKAVEGLLMILQASTVATGFVQFESSSLLADLIGACFEPRLLRPNVCIRSSRVTYIFRIALVLGGCTISKGSLQERKYSHAWAKSELICGQFNH